MLCVRNTLATTGVAPAVSRADRAARRVLAGNPALREEAALLYEPREIGLGSDWDGALCDIPG
jgi:hypothetical protein